MQIQDILELMGKMGETGVSLLEYEAEGIKLHLERPAGPAAATAGNQAAGFPCVGEAGAAGGTEYRTELQNSWLVHSPVVGIYYAAATPDSEPFVQLGSRVEAGTTLCIIEAMKLMNEVTSTAEGQVLELLVNNGQRVEYGQPLMRIGGL